MYLQDIDKKIAEHKELIAALEEQKQAQAKKVEGFDAFNAKIKEVCAQYDVTEHELYMSKAVEISDWIKSLSKLEERPEVYTDLRNYYARIIGREAAVGGKKAPAKPTGPKLEVGTYKNPNSGETVQKIKRNPRQLDEWLEQYSFEVVSGWKQ